MLDSDSEIDVCSDSDDVISSTSYYLKRKRRILLMLLAYAALLGVISVAFLPENDQARGLLLRLPLLILAIAWCRTDANERDHAIGRFMGIGLVLLFLFAFPIYIFQTRGLNGFKTLAITVLFVGAMYLCMIAPSALRAAN